MRSCPCKVSRHADHQHSFSRSFVRELLMMSGRRCATSCDFRNPSTQTVKSQNVPKHGAGSGSSGPLGWNKYWVTVDISTYTNTPINSLLTCLLSTDYWHVCLSFINSLLTYLSSTAYWHVCLSVINRLLICLSVCHQPPTYMSDCLSSTAYWYVCLSVISSLLTCLSSTAYWHFCYQQTTDMSVCLSSTAYWHVYHQ